MQTFRVHTVDSAPAGARPFLEAAQAHFGFLPNLLGELADAPAALEGYLTLDRIFGSTSIGPVDRQVVLTAVSVANGCGYCVAAHTAALKMAGLADTEIAALREGRALSDARLEALRAFATTVVGARGHVPPADLGAFLAAGFSRAQVLEVILGVSMKTLSNYVNHVVDTPLDTALRAFEWEAPREAACCHA